MYFAATKFEKVKMIEKLKCNYFIDDLIDVLKLISNRCIKIHYSEEANEDNIYNIENWSEIVELREDKNDR